MQWHVEGILAHKDLGFPDLPLRITTLGSARNTRTVYKSPVLRTQLSGKSHNRSRTATAFSRAAEAA